MGQMIKAIENELVAIDDRTLRWALNRPFPKMLLALGKTANPCCFVMPARIAATDPFRQISEYVGSGPMRFVRNDDCSQKAVMGGEPITLMAAQDILVFKAWSDVTADLLKRLDMKVDLAAMDWGTVIAR
jgi:hypothetical protein